MKLACETAGSSREGIRNHDSSREIDVRRVKSCHSDQSQLIFDILHETLGAGVFELSLRDVPASIFVNLLEVDDKRRGG